MIFSIFNKLAKEKAMIQKASNQNISSRDCEELYETKSKKVLMALATNSSLPNYFIDKFYEDMKS